LPQTLSDKAVAEFRDKLCRAATRLFAEKGIRGVTMRELASALRVSAMTPYRYFHNKEEILAAVRARAFDTLAAVLEEAYAIPGSTIEKAISLRDAYANFAIGDPDSYRLLFDLDQKDSALYPELQRAMERTHSTMSQFIRNLIAEGVLEGDPSLIGYVFWSTLHGAVCLRLAGKLKPEYDIFSILNTANRALIAGFGPPSRRSPPSMPPVS
jgi:AcrR family transcriptional regulator